METTLNIPDASGLTFEKVWLMMLKTDEQIKETDRQMKESDKQMKESGKQLKEALAETDKRLKESILETKELKQMLFGLGSNLGQITEDYFYNSVATDKTINGIKYDYISRNLKMEGKNLNGEYDIVLINSSRLLVIEVKQKPHIKDVEKFAAKQLPIFKKLFPMYANFKVYGAIAGMTFDKNTIDYALENGLYVLTQNQESKNMQMLNNEEFEAKEF